MPKKQKHLQRSQLLQQIKELLMNHIETVKAITIHYRPMFDVKQYDGMLTELEAAQLNLYTAVDAFDEDRDLGTLIALIKDNPKLTDEHVKDIALCLSENEQDDLVKDFGVERGYAYIKVAAQADRDKLEHFVTTELYPYARDQESYLIV
jgi:hypothetical protein